MDVPLWSSVCPGDIVEYVRLNEQLARRRSEIDEKVALRIALEVKAKLAILCFVTVLYRLFSSLPSSFL